MMQKSPPLANVATDEDDRLTDSGLIIEEIEEHMASVWVGRITGAIGGLCLLLALSVWLARPGHYRLVLAFLTIAMFAAILHSYTFENGG